MIEYVTDIRAASNARTLETSSFSMVQRLGDRMSDLKDIRVRVYRTYEPPEIVAIFQGISSD